MKAQTVKPWLVPGIFFAVAVVLDLVGTAVSVPLHHMIKPALLPLLALTTMAAAGGTAPRLLILAQLLGCTGDIFLIADGFLPFVGGMAAFLAGHVFYMILFGGRSWKGLGVKVWIPSLVVMLLIIFGLVKLIGIEGTMLGPMLVYGMGLMLLCFTGVCGVVRFGGKAWVLVLCGALLFTFSDLLIATQSFNVLPFPGKETTIMATYLAAQALLAAGALKLEK